MPPDLHTHLGSLSVNALRQLWLELFDRPPPILRMTRALLIDCLAYRTQELELGGLSLSARNRLHEIDHDMKIGGRPRFRAASTITPGTRITRKWARETHEVIFTGEHYFYRSARYQDLSQIAALITGLNWNGDKFFEIE